MTEQGHCPACKADMTGELIWQTMLEQSGGNEEEADRKAEMFNATRTKGHWGRKIGMYDSDADRTVKYMCPDCRFTWKRED